MTTDIWPTARVVFFLALMGLLAPLSAANAQIDQRRYDVRIAGFPIGQVNYDVKVTGRKYELQGFLGSTGFFGSFINTRYSGAVIGSLGKNRLAPRIFRGRFERGRQYATVDIEFAGNRPVKVERFPARPAQPYDIDQRSVSDVIDPISALYFLMRDRPQKGLCQQNFMIFEGNRTARIVVQDDPGSEDGLTCLGAYIRVGGFTDAQLEDRKSFPFRLHYVPTQSGNFTVARFVATTIFGKATAVRRP